MIGFSREKTMREHLVVWFADPVCLFVYLTMRPSGCEAWTARVGPRWGPKTTQK